MNLDSPLVILPGVALKNVLEHCDYRGIQVLRKTCHALRNFIDSSSLDLGIRVVKIVMKQHKISLEIVQGTYGKLQLSYCDMEHSIKSEFIQDFATFFKKLTGQKTILRKLRIFNLQEKGLETLGLILSSGKSLQTETLSLTDPNASSLLNFLPFVDPTYLKKLTLSRWRSMPRIINIEDMEKVELWKTVQTVRIHDFFVKDICAFLHFTEVRIKVFRVSTNHIAMLKKKFQSDDPPKSFQLLSRKWVDSEVFNAIGGYPIEERGRDRQLVRKWYFGNGNVGKIILVKATGNERCFSIGLSTKNRTKNVLEECDYIGIQTLRKTCHDLRNFIDDSSLRLGIETVQIIIRKQYITFVFVQENNGKIHLIYYFDDVDNLCTITKFQNGEHKEFDITVQDLRAEFFQDFATFFKILNGQKIALKEFNFTNRQNDDIGALGRILSSGKKLKTEKLILSCQDELRILDVLQFVDPGHLKKLKLNNSRLSDRTLNIDEIEKLELWRRLEVLEIDFFQVEDITKFFHFSKVRIAVGRVTLEHIALLIEKFQSANPPKSFNLIGGYEVSSEVFEAVGREPIVTIDDYGTTRKWYRRSGTPGKKLFIEANSTSVHFKTIEASDVPEGLVFFE